MICWMRVVLPSGRWVNRLVTVFALFYLFVEVMHRAFFFAHRLPLSTAIVQELADIRRGILGFLFVIGSILYGMYRAFGFHPLLQPDYRKWLQSAPWTSRKPLPLGPVHLVWQDAVVVVALGLLAVYGLKLPWFAPLLLVLLPYLLCTTLALRRTGEHAVCYALTFGFGLLVLFSENPTVAAVVAVALYPLAFIGLRRSMKRFPWEVEEDQGKAGVGAVDGMSGRDKTPQWGVPIQQLENPLVSDLSKQAVKTKQIGWPLDKLNPQERLSAPSRMHGVLISLLVGWHVYVLNGIPGLDEWDSSALWLFRMGAGFLALARLLIYCNGYSAPIGFFGRILTGRWIIPGYDRVFVAPLCAVLTSFVAPIVLRSFGLPLGIAVPVSASLVLVVLITMGPTLPRWRLAGCHRLVAGTLNRAEFITI